MLYAVVANGGKQYRVSEGQLVKLEKLSEEVGAHIDFDKILMITQDDKFYIGAPYLTDGKVSAEVVQHGRGEKIKIIKMRRRKHYRKQMGHRQDYTEVKITQIKVN